MIQRVQSIYLILTLVALIFLSIGMDVFVTKVTEANQFEVISHGNVYGIQKDVYLKGEINDEVTAHIQQAIDKVEMMDTMENIPTFYFPFYAFTILLSMLTVVVLFGYKKLERQLKLGRLLFVLNFAMFVAVIVFYNLMKNNAFPYPEMYEISTELGFGFYCVVLALAFSFLANIGIGRDLRLIKSIDRIR